MKAALSYSTAKKLLRLLPEQALYQIERDFEPTPAMMLGTNIEKAFAEGMDNFVTYPGKVRRGKEWEAFQSKNASRTIVNTTEHAKISEAVNSLNRESPWLKEMRYQTHVTGSHNGVDLHGYTDFDNDYSIFDLKITDPTPREFRRSIGKFDYHIQAALYHHCTGKTFYWICMSGEFPHPVRCYQASSSTIEAGMNDLDKACELFKRYQKGALLEQLTDPIMIDPPDYVIERSCE